MKAKVKSTPGTSFTPSFAPQRSPASPQHEKQSASRDAPAALGSGHDFGQIRVHAGTRGGQVAQRVPEWCPLGLSTPRSCPFGGACHACPAAAQAKLTVNRPGDEYEQEADEIADRVMRMPEPRLQRQEEEPEPEDEEREAIQAKPVGEQITPLIQRQEEEPEEEEEESIQTKPLEGNHLQRQEEEPEEEEEAVQARPADGTWLQRQEDEPEEELLPEEEEEEEPVQASRLDGERLQRQEEPEEEPEGEEEGAIQAKAAPGRVLRVAPAQAARIGALRGGGQSLAPAVRTFMEPRFGCDFGRVRVHAGPQAAETAHALDAQAFTVGRDIVFGRGRYVPETTAGLRLLAHELTHVVQQNGQHRPRPIGPFRRGSDRAARGKGLPAIGAHSTASLIQRRLRLTGTNRARRRVIRLIGRGLSPGLWIAIDRNGDVTIGGTARRRRPTRLQREFTTRIMRIVNHRSLVTVGVTEGGRPVVGSYAREQIDITDMLALGRGRRGWDARAALIHELVEQFERQVNRRGYGTATTGAHGIALAAEQAVIGATIVGDVMNVRPNPDGTVSGTRRTTFRYPDGSRWQVTVTITRSNITRVRRRRLGRAGGRP